MKGLLLKDFYVAVKSCKFFFIVDAVFIAISFAFSGFVDGSFLFLIFPVMISGEISITLLSLDEKSKWTKYSGALPYTPAQIVSSKYLFSLMFTLLTTLVTFIALIIYKNTIGGVAFSGAEILFGGVCLASILIVAVGVPPCFVFGTEKGRVIFIMVMLVGAFVLLTFVEKLQAMLQNPVVVLLIIAEVAAIYALSWIISIAVYKRHELTN